MRLCPAGTGAILFQVNAVKANGDIELELSFSGVLPNKAIKRTVLTIPYFLSCPVSSCLLSFHLSYGFICWPLRCYLSFFKDF